MSKKSKSKRFTQQGADSVRKHDERFPYHQRFTDVERKEEKEENNSLGGF